MIEKEMAIRILEDIRRCLNAEDNAQQLTLSCIRQYKKNLMIADNQEVIELSKQLEGLAEDDPKRIELNKQIDDIIRPILTKKE